MSIVNFNKNISNSLMNLLAIIDFFLLNILIIVFLGKTNNYVLSEVFHFHYRAIVFFNMAWMLTANYTKIYKSARFTTMVQVVKSSIFHLIIIFLFFFTLSGLRNGELLSLKSSFALLLIVSIYLASSRIIVLYFVKRYRIKGKDLVACFIIGLNNQTFELVTFLSNSNQYGYKLLGVFTDNEFNYKNVKVLPLSKLKDKIKDDSIKEVFVCTDKFLSQKKLTEILKFLKKIYVKINIVPDFDGVLDLNLEKNYINYLPVYSSEKFDFEKPKNILIKRGFDILFSMLFLILIFSWTFPIVALITKLTSKGPVFYLQERIGINGKPFNIIKYRSMKMHDENQHPLLSSEKDSRITKWGKIMRKYRIDEFPQFINVLLGNMSIVGPRPERKHFINKIEKISPQVKDLQLIKPGITSLGQTLFGYAENVNQMRQRLRYDLLYLKNYSIVMDIKIIFLTIIIVITGKGK